jgi:hypothetical protein
MAGVCVGQHPALRQPARLGNLNRAMTHRNMSAEVRRMGWRLHDCRRQLGLPTRG